MPSWTREAIPSADHRVGPVATTKVVASDPASWEEFGYASAARAFVDVEHVDGGCELRLYRWIGPTAETMRNIDQAGAVLTLTSATVALVDWPAPLGTYGKLEVVIQRITAGAKSTTFRVLQCYLA